TMWTRCCSGCVRPNLRLERTGEKAGGQERAPAAAGRSAAGRWAARNPTKGKVEPMMQAQNIRTALRGKPKITGSTTYEMFRAACSQLAAFDKGAVTVGRFATQGPWEFHPDGDELLHFLDGQIQVILLTDDE